MTHPLKHILDKQFPCRERLRSAMDFVRIPRKGTVLIHIGKCGGRSVRNGIQHAKQNTVDLEIHNRRPVYRKDIRYIIVARNPITRLDSAFRWRYRRLVTEGTRRERYPGERDILIKYESLNNLAEALYSQDGTLNTAVARETRKIHHIRENLSFYLSALLRKCHPDQIVAVLMQENLDHDIHRVFGYENTLREHVNSSPQKDPELSGLAVQNLMRFFEKDYASLMTLYCWGKIEPDVMKRVL